MENSDFKIGEKIILGEFICGVFVVAEGIFLVSGWLGSVNIMLWHCIKWVFIVDNY